MPTAAEPTSPTHHASGGMDLEEAAILRKVQAMEEQAMQLTLDKKAWEVQKDLMAREAQL